MAKFKFRLPKKLTRKQERAIDSMKPIFLTGVPGAGKTVVSTMRLKNSQNAILFTYSKLLTKAIKTQVDDDTKEVVNIHKWIYDMTGQFLDRALSDENIESTINTIKAKGIKFDTIIVDEGQDLHINCYKLFMQLTDNLSVGADEAQKISYNECSKEQEILDILNDVKKIELDENFRNSYNIFNFARQFVPNNPRANDEDMLDKLLDESGDIPVVYNVQNIDNSIQVIEKILNANPTDNIGILCKSIDVVDNYIEALQDKYEISTYHHRLNIPNRLNNILLTTIHSSKGMEFDIVILPDFSNIGYENELYFVASTRAKTELYLLCTDGIPNILDGFEKDSYNIIEYKG